MRPNPHTPQVTTDELLAVQCSVSSELPALGDQLPAPREGLEHGCKRFQADSNHAGGEEMTARTPGGDQPVRAAGLLVARQS